MSGGTANNLLIFRDSLLKMLIMTRNNVIIMMIMRQYANIAAKK